MGQVSRRRSRLPSGSAQRPLSQRRVTLVESLEDRLFLAAQTFSGPLTGKFIFTSAGHGWEYSTTLGRYATDRGDNNEIVEDFGNQDQLTYYADYVLRSGGTVIPMRPIGRQTNQVVVDNDSAGATFTGAWSNSTGNQYYDEDYGSSADAVSYRFASTTTGAETSVATYTPNIPAEGFYPVYTWVARSSNRANQLYRIKHSGGSAEIRVDHTKVGFGWVYLGTYHFNAGSSQTNGAVQISNNAPSGTVIADAIRFGNGMGDYIYTGSGATAISGFPREDENSYHWIARMVGVGTSLNTAIGSGTSNVSAPSNMAEHMFAGSFGDAVYIGFHSNAGGGRGARGLIDTNTTDRTPHQADLALFTGRQINQDMQALNGVFEHDWGTGTTHTFTGQFGELDLGSNAEMDATIIETAFHDTAADAELMRDPRVRDQIGRSTYQATLEYFDAWGGLSAPVSLPTAPINLRAISNAGGQVTLNWSAGASTPAGVNGAAATGYRVYTSTNGYGFDLAATPAGTSVTLTGLDPATPIYVKVSATNAGGESLGSEVLTALPTGGPKEVLIVNGFDRNQRTQNFRYAYAHTGDGLVDRVWHRYNNSFDYVVQVHTAIDAAIEGTHVSSTSNEAVINGNVNLTDYHAVIWILGNESTDNDTFNATEQTKVEQFIAAGGHIFLSGSEVAWDLDQQNNGRTFFETSLKGNFVNDDAGTGTATTAAAGIFNGLGNVVFRTNISSTGGNAFNNLTTQTFNVTTPDTINPQAGAISALTYSGGTGGSAAIQATGTGGRGNVVMFGFPFETMTDATRRQQVMGRILDYFNVGLDPSAAPTGVDLVAGSDTGSSSSDNLTNRDNSSPAKSLTFDVSGTIAGATVTVLYNGTIIGSAVASGATTTVTTTGAFDIPDGANRAITARQTEVGKDVSPDSPALNLTIDTAAPTADVVDVSPDPRSIGVSTIAINLSRAVNGFDISDLSLTRDGGGNLLTGSQTLTTANNVNFSLNNLDSITNVPGVYVLTLTASGSSITDTLAGNTMAANASDTWTNNNAAPTIASLTDAPDPIVISGTLELTANSVADVNGGTLTVNFYRESNGTAGLQVGGDTLVGTDSTGSDYAVQITVPAAPAVYTYYAQATDAQGLSGNIVSTTNTVVTSISDTPGAPDLLAASDTGSSATDNTTRLDNSSGAAALQFDVPGTVSGATVTIYADGVVIGSAVASGTTTTVTTSGAFDLSDGPYTITARQTEPGENESADSPALGIVIDTVAPAAQLTPVSPDPRITFVSSVALSFTRAVTGVDIADFTLTRDGGPNLLTGAQTVTTSDDVSFTVNNLDSVTTEPGSYVLTLVAAGSGIADALAGNALTAADVSDAWTNNNGAPAVASMSDIPDPISPGGTLGLTANSVTDPNGGPLTANFYRESNGEEGLQVDTDTLVATDSINPYAVQFAAPLTPGTYTYYVQMTDPGGLTSNIAVTTNTVAGAASVTPGAPDLRAESDTGSLANDDLTNRDNSTAGMTLSFDVTGTISGATVTIYADGVAIGSAVASGTTTTVTTDGTLDLADGVRSITARQTEPGKNESDDSAALGVTIDTAGPTADVIDVSPDPRLSGVASVAVNFSEDVIGLDVSDLSLRRSNGPNLLTASQAPTGGGSSFTVPSLFSLTSNNGNYNLTLTAAGSGIADAAGNALATNAGDTWTHSMPTWLAPGAVAAWNSETKVLNVVQGATVIADPGPDLPFVNITTTGAVLVINPTSDLAVHFASLNMGGNAQGVRVNSVGAGRTAGNHRVLVVKALSISGTAKLDLFDNDLVIDYDSPANPLEDVGDLLAAGYNFGDWAGTGGIVSSVAANDPFTVGLGYADNAALPLPYGSTLGGALLPGGVDPNDTAIIVKYTWTGDLTLDGVMDFQDLSIFNGNYDSGATTGRLWTDGDLNFDGLLDFQDLSIFNGNYDPNKPSL